MKNIAILVDGKIKFVADWPEVENGLTIGVALANAIEFKDQEQARILICESTGYKGEGVYQQKLEPLKPYEIPSELKIEIDQFCQDEWCCCDSKQSRTCCNIKKFAFIERQPKEETQDELWLEIGQLLRKKNSSIFLDLKELQSTFRIERIK